MATTSLAEAVARVAPLHFPQMTFLATKEVHGALLALGTSDAVMEREIGKLSLEHRDVLMKVLYVCLAADTKNSSSYLKWHGAMYEAAGPGSICRVLTDKPQEDLERVA
jgi:actin related protein 2/3 complex subunit 5